MKHVNLQQLLEHGFNVPKFTVVKDVSQPDMSFSSAESFAVRSSFALEDSESTSFAGQFDTFLNVPRAEVAAAVARVVSGVKNASVEQYKAAHGIDAESEMYVIVQEMVNSELSGIIFTANPQGILNETVIVVGKGLGSGVVEDKVSSTAYYYNRDDDIYYYEQQEEAPLLSEEQLRQLIGISGRIKEMLAADADIEFSIANDEIFILQARPITTLRTDNPIILDNSNIVESYPGISLPLTQDFVRSIYHGIFRRCVLRITKDEQLVNRMENQLESMVDVANMRIYYRISNWYAVLRLLPFSGRIIPMWQGMMGVTNTSVSVPDEAKVPLHTKLNVLRSFVHYLRRSPDYMEKLNEKFAADFPHYKALVAESTEISELLGVYESIKESILGDWDLTLVNDMYTFIYTALSGRRNRRKISDIKNLESMKPVLAINELIETARSYGADSQEYKTAAADYIEKYGDRCLCELKLETRTYRTDPQMLDEYVVKRLSESGEAAERAETVGSVRGIFANRARTGIMNREISRMNRSRIFGLSREIFLKIGESLASEGRLKEARDVFYLHIDELQSNALDMRAMVDERRREQVRFESVPVYSRLVFAERIVDKTGVAVQSNILNRRDVLYGTPSSAGRVTGEVLVIDEPDAAINTAGKILVARSTDPGWVFLLQPSIGIIAEKGSLLSHTAIISRELHKPGVVNVKDCTKLLKSGDMVELDAYEGKITLLKEV